ncbi:MAG: thiol:disulfide interchange protein DsbA [Colwellia sp.]|jgi:thiol:disulfide interchange protein DsbA
MKKLVSLFIILLLPLMASATNYQAGKHYTVVSEQATKKPEVREFFSFYCPHCFRFEPFMAGVKKQLPEGVKFEYNHVDFLRGASPTMQQTLSKAVAVAEQMGMESKLMGAIFNYIHVKRSVFTSEKDVRKIFVLNGVDGEKFDKLMKSFGVNSKAKQMKKKQDYYAKSRGLTSVPAVIVNGRYRIENSALNKESFEEDYNNLVKYLLALK